MTLGYTLGADRSINIKAGVGLTTMMGCDEPLMQLQKWGSDLLSRKSYYALTDSSAQTPPHLQLRFSDGSRWELEGEPTPRTKYGNDGQSILLEIEAQHVPCSDSMSKESECLRVREVRWGVRDGKGEFNYRGEWKTLGLEAIDGFKHSPGWHGVLNLVRYGVKDAVTGAASFDYVYSSDMTRFSN